MKATPLVEKPLFKSINKHFSFMHTAYVFFVPFLARYLHGFYEHYLSQYVKAWDVMWELRVLKSSTPISKS